METINIKKADKKAFQEHSNKIWAAQALAQFAGEMLSSSQKTLWSTIHELYPKTKGMIASYDHEKQVITLRGKDFTRG